MKNRSDSFIALGVVACSLIVLGALTYALSGWRPGKSRNVLFVDYPDVTGIRVHSQVRYAGAPAGTVSEMRLLTDEERMATANATVRVTLERPAGSTPVGVEPLPKEPARLREVMRANHERANHVVLDAREVQPRDGRFECTLKLPAELPWPRLTVRAFAATRTDSALGVLTLPVSK